MGHTGTIQLDYFEDGRIARITLDHPPVNLTTVAILDDLLEAVSKETEIDIPEELIHDEIHRILDMYNQRLQMQGLNLNQYLEFTKKSMEDIEKETEPEAKRNVTYRYMIEEISKLENIEIAEEELNKEIENMAIKYNMTKEELIKAFGGKDMISYDLKMRKTIEFLKNNN